MNTGFDLPTPRRFFLWRHEDDSGVSGTGAVAQGVVWHDGTATLKWSVPGKPNSEASYRCMLDLMEIHGHGGKTVAKWLDK